MKSWFKIKAQATDAQAEISIYDSIGMWGVTANDFIDQIKAITSKSILVSINSPGGSLFDALAMYNALRSHGAEITTKTMGIAASAASVVFMAGDKRVMPENTYLMVHNCIGPLIGNAEEHREFADVLDQINQSIVTTYVARTGKTEEEVKALLDDETFLTAAQCIELGFADELEPALKIAASFDVERLPQNIQDALKAPEEKPTEKPADKPVTAKSFAAQISDIATAAGFEAHTEAWLLDASITTIEQVQAAVSEAVEIRDLCIYAKQPDLAAKMIDARIPLVEARAKLCGQRAAIADAALVNSLQPSPKNPPVDAPQAVLNTAAIYAARK